MTTKRPERQSRRVAPPSFSDVDQRPPRNRPTERRSSAIEARRPSGDGGRVDVDAAEPEGARKGYHDRSRAEFDVRGWAIETRRAQGLPDELPVDVIRRIGRILANSRRNLGVPTVGDDSETRSDFRNRNAEAARD
jgi:hypothetical protein